MAFTSIQTAGWAASGGVQAAYDKLFRWNLKSNLVCYPLIDVEPEDVTSAGSSFTIYKQAYFAAADIVAATTPLTEESDVTPVKLPNATGVTLTPTEYGLAVVRTEKLTNRGLVPVKPIIAQAVARHCAETIDYMVQTDMRAATTKVRAQGRASTVTITGTDYQRATDIRKAVTTLRANNAEDVGGGLFVGVFHPDVIHDLREETGSGSWRVPNEYGTSQEKIYKGEFGEFEGVRFISTSSTYRGTDDNDGASSEPIHYSHILGREALAKAELLKPQTVVSPQTDLLKRHFGVGWKADLDFAIFRQEAIVALEAASSLT